jgi:hypothetical protein
MHADPSLNLSAGKRIWADMDSRDGGARKGCGRKVRFIAKFQQRDGGWQIGNSDILTVVSVSYQW